ncbi:MAG TPA: J domain-containing protein [Anaerolineae bacterium]|jgi:curved DNA-binding protein
MEYKDYYKILGVAKNATLDTIEKAYRKLARKYHSDVNPNDQESEDRYREASEAHAVLANPDRRAKYDQLGARWKTHLRSGDANSFDWHPWTTTSQVTENSNGASQETKDASAQQASGFSNFYDSVFAGMEVDDPTAPQRGQDYHQTVQIALAEAFKGASRILRIGGRRIKVKIPRGAQTGTKVRIRNEGGEGQSGGPKGDLYLEVEVLPDPVLRRENDDLHLDLPVDLYTAVLGGEATVPTFRGKIKLKIPPETQSGRVFRLKGQGMPRMQEPDERGELYVKILIQLPENLTDEEFALFEELADIRGL